MSATANLPAWARFLGTESAYRLLLIAVEAELRHRGYDVVIEDGVARSTRPGEPTQAYGLQNLAQRCNQSPRAQWPDVIRDHFERVEQGAMLEDEPEVLAAVRDQLRVKLYPASYVENAPNPPHRLIADDLVAVLVRDLPSSIVTVPRDDLERWGVEVDELFDVALRNLKTMEPIERDVIDMEGGKVTALVGESYFASSHALFLEDHFEIGHRGALVAVPHRHAALVHVIEDAAVIKVTPGLIGLANGMFDQGPGSVSSSVYWWRHDRGFLRLPAEVTPTEITLSPPDAFMEMLEELSQPPS